MCDVYNNTTGYVSVFFNVIKSSEVHYVLYNPITCGSDKYTIEELEEFARCSYKLA